MTNEGWYIPLPEYKCHKKVWALKIYSVELQAEGNARLHFVEDPPYAPRAVSASYVIKHSPKAGGYWVMYKDGYESWSPGKEFEEGYTRV